MIHKRFVFTVAAMLLVFVVTTRVYPDRLQDFVLAYDVLGCAGGTIAGGNQQLFFTLGEPVTGLAGNDEFQLWSGVVHPQRATMGITEIARSPRVETRLLPPSPNPFNPLAKIRYNLAFGTEINLVIYDIQGRVVRILERRMSQAGPHEIAWNGRSDQGAQLPSGLYFCELRAGGERMTQRLVLLK